MCTASVSGGIKTTLGAALNIFSLMDVDLYLLRIR